ncbi:MAG: exodeoxyribonuclease III [Candidatus Saccharibacteria bacterium]|nr:exodeoxyribonuclease III [Candidatus Saccharibacteria bacterium]
MRIFSWNVNGLRAVLRKGALQSFLEQEKPDVLCLQEVKAKPEQVDFNFSDYNVFWNSAERAGYSGTAILVRKDLKNVVRFDGWMDFPELMETEADEIAKREGRILVLDFGNFYLADVYTPNSKPDLSRLNLREKKWDPGFLKILKLLEREKPVVTCGDFNAAHEEIDIARPKTNHHSAGFTDEERRGVTNLINAGFIDTFRSLNPKVVRYTWWSHWGKARENNVGWRIDYFFISKSLKNNLQEAGIYENVMGSDHCPVSIELEF